MADAERRGLVWAEGAQIGWEVGEAATRGNEVLEVIQRIQGKQDAGETVGRG